MRTIPGTDYLYKKVKKRTGKLHRFAEIKTLTSGYLSPEAYKAIYDCAYQAQEGIMIDIGPAQGGSSISIGLGIRDSGKAKKAKVYSIEKGVGSDALPTRQDKELNASTLEKNIDKYRLNQICNVLIGDVKDVYQEIEEDTPLSLMFIDSVDELVESEVNGKLVDMGDSKALADAMLKVWRQEVPWQKQNLKLSSIFEELEPTYAAEALIQLALGSKSEKETLAQT